MARAVKRRPRHKQKQKEVKREKSRLPFTIHNYVIFGIGIVVLLFGYIFLSIGPIDSFWSLTLAPIILFIGYVVIIPLSFLYQHKSRRDVIKDQHQPPEPRVIGVR